MRPLHASFAWRAPCVLLAVLLWWSAAMQWNDPDPLVWVAMYAALGTVPALAGAGWHVPALSWLAALGALAWSASLAGGVVELFAHHPPGDLLTGMAPDRPYVEEARESLGLLIGALAAGYVVWLGRRGRDVNRP